MDGRTDGRTEAEEESGGTVDNAEEETEMGRWEKQSFVCLVSGVLLPDQS